MILRLGLLKRGLWFLGALISFLPISFCSLLVAGQLVHTLLVPMTLVDQTSHRLKTKRSKASLDLPSLPLDHLIGPVAA